jgi:hypothetical protein
MDWDVRDIVIPLDSVTGNAVPLPAGWEPFQAERRAGELVVLCKREHLPVAGDQAEPKT